MNRVVASSIISIFIIALLAVGYYYFSVYKEKFSNPEEALPPSAALIIKGNLNNIYTELDKQGIWNQLDTLSLIGDIRKEFEILLQNTADQSEIADLLESEQTIVSLQVTGAEKADLLFLMPSPKDISIATMRKTLLGEQPDEYKQRSFSGKEIYEINFSQGWQFTFSVSNGVFIGSFTSGLVEDAIRQQETGKAFWGNKNLVNLFSSVSASAQSVVAINYPQLSTLFSVSLNSDFSDKLHELSVWAGWSVHALTFEKKQITAKGFILANDSMQMISGFNNCHGGVSEVVKALSQNTIAYQTYSFSDECNWIGENRKKMSENEYVLQAEKNIARTEKDAGFPVREKFKKIINTEVALALSGNPSGNLDNNTLAFIKVKSRKDALQTMSQIDKAIRKNGKPAAVEQFKNHEIRLMDVDGLLPALFGNSFTVIRKNYYTLHNNFLVFANKPSLLRKYIEDVEGGLLITQLPETMQAELKKAERNMYALLIRPEQCTPVWQRVSNEATRKMLSRSNYLERFSTFYYSVSNVQNSEGNCNFIITTQNPEPKQKVTKLWTFFSDTTLLNGPFMFSRDKDVFILYQDDAMILHCLDQSGNNRWTLQLDTTVIGNICQGASDNDGKMQFAFATDSQVYIVTESGTVATKYPQKLPAATTIGLTSSPASAIYFVPCNNQIVYAFNYGGRPAKDWSNIKWSGNKFESTVSPDGRSVVFIDDQNLMYYTMDGKSRLLKPVNELNLSNYHWTNDSVPEFACLDVDGNKLRIKNDGTFAKISGTPALQWLGQTTEGGNIFNYTLTENRISKISADNNIIASAELKGQVGKSSVISAENSVYCVLSTDKTLNLFDSHLKQVSGFPVPANGYANMTIGSKIYLLVLEGKGKLTFYEL